MKKSKRGNRKNLVELKIFIPSILIVLAICIPFSLYEDASLDMLNHIFNEITKAFTWGYIWYGTLITIAALYFSFSKYGKVVLGDLKEKARFTLFEYASILVAMGLGSTIMRTGMVEWTNVAQNPPFGAEANSMEAIMWGSSYSMFLWSFQTFAIFVMAAPALGYIMHVRKKPFLRISEACRCIFGDKFIDGLGGKMLDMIFLISIFAGAAVTLGLGAPIITHNLAELLNIEITFTLTLIVTIIWVFLFSMSAYLGIEKGIKRLSTFNMYMAGAFTIFILIAGPGIFILDYFTDSVGFLLTNYFNMSLYTNSINMEKTTYIVKNTVFWFAYSATWAMLHSVFAAKISRGRTIKEMILTYLLAPTLISWVATGVLGGLGVNRYLTGDIPVMDVVREQSPMAVIPEILASLPFSTLAITVFIILATVFLTTTLDSTTYTVASYLSTKNMAKREPSKILRIFVAGIITFIGLTLMRIGGLAPLSVLSGLMGIPIIFIQFLTVYAAKKMMDEDRAWETNVKHKNDPVEMEWRKVN
ncbi:Choline-glycine betaine transporter [Halobacillus karajensis]|uniref:BCCT family transporter n=1 Tax=Halobacillus karajensis TaxID=195088 RepID=UPI0008A72645|nr:BCCT family transporter [Halobacillus karajensis]SEH79015.1 Choline-glycine betaine transporter [Halobacillus karajensis]